MANEQNLKPLSTEKAREIGTKGGIKSGVARRKKKYIKEQLEQLMLLDLTDKKIKDKMLMLGIKEDDMSLQMAMCVSLVQSAIQGNIKAFQVIRDQLDQNPKDGVIEPLSNIFFINDLPKGKKEEIEKLKEK